MRANCFYFVLNDLLRAAPARRSQSTTFSKHVEFVSDTCIKCRCRCRRRCCHDYFQSDSNSRLTYTNTHTQRCAAADAPLSLSLWLLRSIPFLLRSSQWCIQMQRDFSIIKIKYFFIAQSVYCLLFKLQRSFTKISPHAVCFQLFLFIFFFLLMFIS